MRDSETTTLNAELPPDLLEFIREQMAAGHYATPGAFIEALLRSARRKVNENLETLLLEGQNSGEPVEATPEFWDERRRKLAEHLQGTP